MVARKEQGRVHILFFLIISDWVCVYIWGGGEIVSVEVIKVNINVVFMDLVLHADVYKWWGCRGFFLRQMSRSDWILLV